MRASVLLLLAVPLVAVVGCGNTGDNQADSGAADAAVAPDLAVACVNPATDCPSTSTLCVVAACTAAGNCSTTNAAAGETCSDNGGKVCDGNGKCVACLAATDCPATGTVCAQATCTNNTCGATNTALGTVCTDHSGVVCDGNGMCVAMHCMDHSLDGDETDVDCGGSCPGCAANKNCVVAGDCADKICDSSKVCVLGSCSDSVKNQDETDVDCGGSCPGKCGDRKQCKVNADCVSAACFGSSPGTCVSCTDNVKDGTETDVDCGGSCGACNDGQACANQTDCKSKVCSGTPQACQAPTCVDLVRNGNETDTDCGGGTCAGCAVGKGCLATTDCAAGEGCDKSTKHCDANQCNDGLQNSAETDIDCGGGACTGCAVNKKCLTTSDCLAGEGCDVGTKTCDANLCNDGLQNGAETDVDCGGGTCNGCAVGKACLATADCAAGEGCDKTTKHCDATQCNDALQNSAETDVDCGGGTCSGCAVGKKCLATSDCLAGEGCDKTTKTCDANECNDGTKDASETDIDCGGSICSGCGLNKKCLMTSDCAGSEGCDQVTHSCDANQCNDGLQDSAETDVDCGGGICNGCAVGKACLANADCAGSEGCDKTTKHCDATQCNDGTQDAAETDIDCGGGTCSGCGVGKKCLATADCASGGCDKTTKTCDANQCNDGTQDAAETDIDCGGGTCGGCAVGKKCLVTADCLVGEGCDKTTLRCDANQCNDGLQNGAETDVDCGGGTCAQCAIGLACVANTDCSSGNCHLGVCSPSCLNQTFNSIGAAQQVTLPGTGNYTIIAAGAQGATDAFGGGSGGLGALNQAQFALTSGNVLQIVVGARPVGPVGPEDGGAGGGGTFVYVSATQFPLPTSPLLASGGGAGGGGSGGLITTAGGNGGGNGGTNGSGGLSDPIYNAVAGGGVGWTGVGANGLNGGGGGQQWGGGSAPSDGSSGSGGFGGGGGAGAANKGVGGGGGGYSGGGGGGPNSAGHLSGGGGGSFVDASAIAGSITQTPATRAGSGFVTITGPLSSTCP